MDVLLATNALPALRERYTAAQQTQPKQQSPAAAAATLLFFIIKLAISITIGVLAVRLNWRCNRNVLYAILSWIASVPYLVYRALFGSPCA